MRKIYLFYFSVFYLSACKKFDKPEQIPSYIYIDKIDLSVTATQGTASHGIIDAWVYVNDQPVGVFNLPATIPILAEGNQKITISPGIKDDGLTESRKKYTMLQDFITYDVNLKPGEIVTLSGTTQPVVTYYPSSEIEIWYENFDNATIEFNAASNSDAGVTFVDDSTTAFEGQGMGKIELGAGLSYARVITATQFDLPKGGKPVYVELNYNTNNSMAIGIQAIDGVETDDIDNTVLNSTDGVWKKIYVNLTEIVSQQPNADAFKFIMTVSKESSVSTVENYFDNFKVVYDK